MKKNVENERQSHTWRSRAARIARPLAFTVVAAMTAFAPQSGQATGQFNDAAIVVRSDAGGGVYNYAVNVSKARKHATRIALSGNCQSACTLYLSLPSDQICISPGASFSFHRAYGASAVSNNISTDYMMQKYPVWVRSWIQAHGGLSNNLIHMPYSYAARYVQPCARQAGSGQTYYGNSVSRARVTHVAPVTAYQNYSQPRTRTQKRKSSGRSR